LLSCSSWESISNNIHLIRITVRACVVLMFVVTNYVSFWR
jgi:hypothetical protein